MESNRTSPVKVGTDSKRSILRQRTDVSEFNTGEVNINTIPIHFKSKSVTFADKKRKPLCQVFKIPSLQKKENLIKLKKKKSCQCLIL